VALVDGRDTRNSAALVIENLVRNMWRNPKSRHPGYAGPAQIMEAPPGHPRELIEPTLGMSEVLEGLGTEQCEDKRPSPVCTFQDGQCLLRQVHDVRFGILCSCFGDRPNPFSQVQLLPMKAGDFLAPLSGERQKLDNRTIWTTDFSSGKDDLS
jgi:hypothetical protein